MTYLRDRAVGAFTALACMTLASFTLYAHGTDPRVIAFCGGIFVVGAIAALALGYLTRRSWWNRLEQTLGSGEDVLLACELLDRPSYGEGQLYFEALSRASKAMRDEVAALSREQRDYREYVETWVHEVKTPIAAARLVAKNSPSEATSAMDAELDSIESYVEQALYYARSTSLERDFLLREVSLSDVVRRALRAKARTLISAHMAPDLSGLDARALVRTDAKWLVFAIGQILVNSAKYRRPGEEPSVIRVCSSRRQTGADSWCTRLAIADEGIGIPASDLPRVFDRGFTGENGRAFAQSTGMGLYLVRELCQKMGLSVGVDSAGTDLGCTVWIDFPDSTRLPE